MINNTYKIGEQIQYLIHSIGQIGIGIVSEIIDDDTIITTDGTTVWTDPDNTDLSYEVIYKYTLLDQEGNKIGGISTEQDVIDFCNATFEYDRRDADVFEEEIYIDDAIRELEKCGFKISTN